MDVQQKGIVTLIRSSLTGERLPLPLDFNLDAAYTTIVSHGITSMAYSGAVNCGVDKSDSVMKKLFIGSVNGLLHSEAQMNALNAVFTAFDTAGVDHMPLKGSVLKDLYPSPELRHMGDADILIRNEQYNCIEPIMARLGFTAVTESNHEYIWRSTELLLELHKRLIPSYNEDYYRYFGDGWHLAKQQDGYRYSMTYEDEYIYLLTHFAKHYRDGGIGCRHLTDLWVYIRSHQNLNESYIANELSKLRLLEFEHNIRALCSVWFEDAESDRKSDYITDFIFQNGSWGSAEAHLVSAGAKNASAAGSISLGRAKSVIKLVFPSTDDLKCRYPILRSHPILLPVIWPVRIVTAVACRRKNIQKQWDSIFIATDEKIEAYQQALNYVGLEFRFKED